ncbi:MAG: peptidase M10 [Candidatus Pseudobacter hemicellulosilyticus]|uniref:Peptidase M10 n=1 Tax=Candidatus Pseudobacter hemicellulosilyticus TaxID=3121375 RepID=A0AAJ5WWY8_9BACT|nr:MAG: peptidase M10 [Pseudobacter sp.]
MGEATINQQTGELVIQSILYFYGQAATEVLSCDIAEDISRHWNEPRASIKIHGRPYRLRFLISGVYAPDLEPETVWYNDDPKINFFRLENFAEGNISFVDGYGCNTGYFKLANLLQTSTTAAHEYGHSLGLYHPSILDIRGGFPPAIMYPRGTLCDPAYQYDPKAAPGANGGTLDPRHRKVLEMDIKALELHKLDFNEAGKSIVGDFSSIFHQQHKEQDS